MTLQLAVDQLRSQSDEDSRERLLALVDRQVGLLSDLTDDLLLLSLSDTGRLETHPATVELEPILRDLALERGAADAEVESPADLAVWADPTHVQRILGNLVHNAFVHGGAPVRITASEHDGQVEIRVSDSGPGVPDDFVPRLFDRFARGSGIRGGAGLGLSIVAELARLNGGGVRYEPHAAGRPGATFVVRLPQTALESRPGPDVRTLDGRPDETGPPAPKPLGVIQARLAIALANNRQLTDRVAAVLDDALAIRAWNTTLRKFARATMRRRRRLVREGSALADTTRAFDEELRDISRRPDAAAADTDGTEPRTR